MITEGYFPRGSRGFPLKESANNLRGFIEKKYASESPEVLKAIRLFYATNNENHDLTEDDIEVFASYVASESDGSTDRLNIMPRDREYVNRLEETFSHDARSQEGRHGYPKVLEAVLIRQIELADWFGEAAVTFQAHPFDDYANGVDLVVQWNTEYGPVRVAIDVTIASSLEIVLDKIAKTRDGIMQGHSSKEHGVSFLSNVKYYEDPESEEQMSLDTLPKVIIGMDVDQVRDLVSKSAKALRKEPGAKADLAKDPYQMMLLEEVRSQLERQLWLSTVMYVQEAVNRNVLSSDDSIYRGIYELFDANKNKTEISVADTGYLYEILGDFDTMGVKILEKRLDACFNIANLLYQVVSVISEKRKSLGVQVVAEAVGLQRQDRVAQAIDQAVLS